MKPFWTTSETAQPKLVSAHVLKFSDVTFGDCLIVRAECAGCWAGNFCCDEPGGDQRADEVKRLQGYLTDRHNERMGTSEPEEVAG